MKIEKKYAILIVVLIFLIFLFSSLYFFMFGVKIITPNTENQDNNVEAPIIENPQEKTLEFASASCLVSGGNDIVKFRIKSTGIDIGLGEIAAFLDGANICTFTDQSGSSIDSISLKADTTTNEFSCTTTDHKTSRIISISSPAGSLDQIVTCS